MEEKVLEGFDRGKVVIIWTSSKGMNGMSEDGGRNSGVEGTGFLIGKWGEDTVWRTTCPKDTGVFVGEQVYVVVVGFYKMVREDICEQSQISIMYEWLELLKTLGNVHILKIGCSVTQIILKLFRFQMLEEEEKCSGVWKQVLWGRTSFCAGFCPSPEFHAQTEGLVSFHTASWFFSPWGPRAWWTLQGLFSVVFVA